MHLEYLYATGGFGASLERVKLLVLFPGRVSRDFWCRASQYFCPPPPASNVSLNGAHNPNCSTKIHSDQVVLKGLWAHSGDFQTAVLLEQCSGFLKSYTHLIILYKELISVPTYSTELSSNLEDDDRPCSPESWFALPKLGMQNRASLCFSEQTTPRGSWRENKWRCFCLCPWAEHHLTAPNSQPSRHSIDPSPHPHQQDVNTTAKIISLF